MKRIIFIFTILLTLVSCKKEVIEPNQPTQVPCTQQFVEMYSFNNYDLTFYHNGVEVDKYLATPNGSNLMTGFYATTGDSVRVKTLASPTSAKLHVQIRVDSEIVVDVLEWINGNPNPPTQIDTTFVIP